MDCSICDRLINRARVARCARAVNATPKLRRAVELLVRATVEHDTWLVAGISPQLLSDCFEIGHHTKKCLLLLIDKDEPTIVIVRKPTNHATILFGQACTRVIRPARHAARGRQDFAWPRSPVLLVILIGPAPTLLTTGSRWVRAFRLFVRLLTSRLTGVTAL